MSTRFGRFILSKKFTYFFLFLMLLSLLLTAYQTERAVSCLLGRPHIWGLSYIVLGLLNAVVVFYDKLSKTRGRKTTCAVKILSCFMIYEIMFGTAWFLLACLLPIPAVLEAFITILLMLAAIFLVANGRRNAKEVETITYQVRIKGLKHTRKIVLISDLHLGIFVRTEHVKKVVKEINQMKPDVVVIAGDILDVDLAILEDLQELRSIARELRKISSTSGVYLALGNHDPSMENKKFRKFLKDSKIRVLHNSCAELADFYLIGRSDAANNERKDFADILPIGSIKKPMVLIDHDPQGIRDAQQMDIPLVLSGHTHRGQFWPMDFFTRCANGAHFFYGKEQFGDTQAIISSGAGYFNLPIRIGSNNEVVQIIITGGK